MPQYPQPADQWFAQQLAQIKRDLAALKVGGTQFVVDPAGVCRGIIGNLETDTKGEATGLGKSWGIASQLPIVSSLPASPVDGREVYYQNAAMAEAGVTWHLRYREGSASAHKWEYVGGAAWETSDYVHHEIISGVAGSWHAPNTSNALTIPIIGEYEFDLVTRLLNNSAAPAANLVLGIVRVSEPTVEQFAFPGEQTPVTGGAAWASNCTFRKVNVTSAVALTPAVKWTAEAVHYWCEEVGLRIRPVRVG